MAFTLFMYVPGTVMFLSIFHIILLSAVCHCLNEVPHSWWSFVADKMHCTFQVQFNLLILLSCDEVKVP
jgi:fumarate reductase subunit C